MRGVMRQALTKLGVLTSHPAAFIAMFAYVTAWLVLSLDTFDWHSAATVATWFMTLLIQRAEHRDTQAIHAKLDELLRADGQARNELVEIDEKEPEAIERHRSRQRNRD
jgi:low affinity Fe/Cu permease